MVPAFHACSSWCLRSTWSSCTGWAPKSLQASDTTLSLFVPSALLHFKHESSYRISVLKYPYWWSATIQTCRTSTTRKVKNQATVDPQWSSVVLFCHCIASILHDRSNHRILLLDIILIITHLQSTLYRSRCFHALFSLTNRKPPYPSSDLENTQPLNDGDPALGFILSRKRILH